MIALALALAASTAIPPVYLSCQLKQEERSLPVDIAVDESNQQVTVALPTTGRTVTRRAIFSPADVVVPDDNMTWTIDRVHLAFKRTLHFMPKSDPGELGDCKIKPAPAARAF
jgi:hypothetical protein